MQVRQYHRELVGTQLGPESRIKDESIRIKGGKQVHWRSAHQVIKYCITFTVSCLRKDVFVTEVELHGDRERYLLHEIGRVVHDINCKTF